MKITLNDLKEKPCPLYDYLYKKYDIKEEFDPIEEIEETNCIDMVYDVAWLIKNCEKMQTQEMFDYYLDMKPSYEDVQSVIHICNVFQTQENFKKYLDLDPDYENVSLMIYSDEAFQTPENFECYMRLNTGKEDLEWLLENCQPFKEWYEKQQEVVV